MDRRPGKERRRAAPGIPNPTGEERATVSDDSAKADEIKGRAKEAAGAATGDDGMKREGKVDQAVADVKKTVDGVADKIKRFLHRDET